MMFTEHDLERTQNEDSISETDVIEALLTTRARDVFG
jgi:hypothetical protein